LVQPDCQIKGVAVAEAVAFDYEGRLVLLILRLGLKV